jgi:hypothetical protein
MRSRILLIFWSWRCKVSTDKPTKRQTITFLKKWSAELRSGTYQQGEGQLRNGNSYCCLGVATCVSGDTPVQRTDDEGLIIITRFPKTHAFLGSSGVSIIDTYLPSIHMVSFPTLNDDFKMSFDEIADIIDIIVWEMQHGT